MSRRLRTALELLSIACLAAPCAVHAQAAPLKTVINLPGARPSTTLSAATRVGNLLFVSGQLGYRATGDTTIQGQTKLALENLQAILTAAGSKPEDVVKCTVFLTDLADFQGMNTAYSAFFTKDPPARSTVVVAALVTRGAKTEIECIAAMPPK